MEAKQLGYECRLSRPFHLPALGWVTYQFLCFWGRDGRCMRIFDGTVGGAANPALFKRQPYYSAWRWAKGQSFQTTFSLILFLEDRARGHVALQTSGLLPRPRPWEGIRKHPCRWARRWEGFAVLRGAFLYLWPQNYLCAWCTHLSPQPLVETHQTQGPATPLPRGRPPYLSGRQPLGSQAAGRPKKPQAPRNCFLI